MSTFPDYYDLLSVDKNATFDQIKTAYRKESLKCHPDRLPQGATDAERRASTARFQQVADAFFTLSDPVRRREYDLHYPSRASRPPPSSSSSSSYPDDPFSTDSKSSSYSSDPPPAGPSASSFFSSFFGGGGSASSPPPGTTPDGQHADANETFTSVFEDLLTPEVGRVAGRTWSIVGGMSGAAMGFILGNVPGAMAGGFAGNRLGAVRDAKGKSVGEVFVTLSSSQKAEILRALAAKVFSTIGQNSI